MPSHKEFYEAISNISINADTLNLSTDDVESKIDTANGLLTTASADIAIIKEANILNGIGEVQVTVNNSVNVNGYDSANGSWVSLPLNEGATSIPVSYDGAQGTVFPVSTTAKQGTGASLSNFTSTTPASLLVSSNAGRVCLTIFNEGAGNLYIAAGAGCTTTVYQVRLSSGDYWECPKEQVTMEHSAVFGSTGTARVTQIV